MSTESNKRPPESAAEPRPAAHAAQSPEFPAAHTPLSATVPHGTTRDQRMVGLVERLPFCVMIHDQGRILYANRAAASLLGCGDPPQLIGTRLEDWLSWQAADTALAALDAQQPAGGVHRVIRLHRRRGRTAYVEAFETDILFGDRSARELVLRELNEPSSTLETLRETQSVLVAITQSASDYIMSLHPVTAEILFLNRSTVLGKTPQDYHGVSLFDLIEPQSVPVLRQCMNRALATGGTETCEIWYDHPDRGLRYFEVGLCPVEKDGEIFTLTLNSRDLTDQLLAEQALHDRDEELRMLVERLPAIMWTTDRRLLISACRGAGLRKRNLRPEQVVGNSLEALLGAGRSAAEAILYHRQALQGKPADFEITWHRQTVQVHVAPFRNAGGDIAGTVGVAFDISRRKHAEQRLMESERLLADSQRLTGIGSWEWDVVSGARRWSEETFRIVGLPFSTSPPSLLEMLREYVVEEDRAETELALAEAVESGTTTSVEFRIRRTDGQVRTIWLKSRTLRNDNGRPQRIVGSLQDITEKRQTESMLQDRLRHEAALAELSAALASVASGERLDAVLDDALVRLRTLWNAQRALLLLLDADTGQPYCACESHSAAVDSYRDELAPERCAAHPWFARALRAAELAPRAAPCPLEQGRPEDHTGVRLRELAAGLTLPLQVGGNVIGYICLCGVASHPPRHSLASLEVLGNLVAHAIVRRRTDDALRRAHEQLRHVTASVCDGLWSVRWHPQLGFRQLYLSPVMEQITGRPTHFFLQDFMKWLEAVFDEDVPRVRNWAEQLLQRDSQHAAGDHSSSELEYRIVLPDGTIRWVRDSVVVRYLPDGELQLDGVLADISQHKLAEQQARQHQEELAHAGRLSTMGQLVASIAHEINQPLYAITNFADACRTALPGHAVTPDSQLRPWIDQISEQADRAARIISRMREFVRKNAQRKSTLDVNELLKDSIALVDFEARKLNVQIQLQVAAQLPQLLGDRVQLQQVMVNLLRNAFDALQNVPPRQRRVTIRADASDSTIQVRVADQGRGLDAVEPGKLFEPFFTTKPQGMGMGLAISRSIVEAYGGQIWAASNAGSGTTFHVVLPVPEQQKGTECDGETEGVRE